MTQISKFWCRQKSATYQPHQICVRPRIWRRFSLRANTFKSNQTNKTDSLVSCRRPYYRLLTQGAPTLVPLFIRNTLFNFSVPRLTHAVTFKSNIFHLWSSTQQDWVFQSLCSHNHPQIQNDSVVFRAFFDSDWIFKTEATITIKHNWKFAFFSRILL